jgi:hypothetical protein
MMPPCYYVFMVNKRKNLAYQQINIQILHCRAK